MSETSGAPESATPEAETPDPPLSLRGPAKWAIGTLIAVIVVDAVAAVVDLSHWALLNDAVSGEEVTGQEFDDSDNRVGIVALIVLALFVATVITFIVWFRRAYRNLPRLGIENLRYKAGWAVGAWFVPILNLFRPLQIANDIWRGSDPELPARPTNWREQRVTPLFGWWWAVWLLASWLGNRGGFSDVSSGTLEEQKNAAALYVGADVLDIVAAVLVIQVIRKVTERQEARREGREREVAVAA